MATTTSKKKERGIFLTVMLIYFVVRLWLNAVGLYSLFRLQGQGLRASGLNETWSTVSIIYEVFLLASGIAILAGVFKWKRIAATSLLFYVIISPVTDVIVGQLMIYGYVPTSSLVSSLFLYSLGGFIITAGLWVWAISRKWKYFV